MRLLQYKILLFFIIVAHSGKVAAQDKESLKQLLKLDDKTDTFQLKPSLETGDGLGISFMHNLKGYGFDNYLLPQLILNSSKAWKFDQNVVSGNVTYRYMTLWDFNPIFYGLPGNAGYSGLYGTAVHQVNDKLSLGTSMFIPDKIRTIMGPYNGSYINSSIYVGYKFSEKFSIKAGMNIRRYENPWMNGGYVP
jgi:hypothetical protein